MQLAALPSDPTAEPEAADDVDEVFWTSVRDLKGLKGDQHLTHKSSMKPDGHVEADKHSALCYTHTHTHTHTLIEHMFIL